jgi:malate synthase
VEAVTAQGVNGSNIKLSQPAPAGSENGGGTPTSEVLSQGALDFVAALAKLAEPRIATLLEARRARKARWDAGAPLSFLTETKAIRDDATWRVAAVPEDLLDRRVEITGPVDRKMIINALSSGASCYMADFEDSTSPTWENVVRGQANLIDAVRRTITFDDPATGKHYALADRLATLLVRPRGLHLVERHALLGGKPVPASVFDLGLYLFHNARELLARGTGPYFYFPKLEHHLEARLVNDVFNEAERLLGIPRGTCKVTVLIETLPAAFQMEEILYELRDRSAGLNCGRWDYIFSTIKTERARPECVLPDRSLVTMEQPMMKAYTELLIKTCHRRGAHAMGGMAAQIPIKNDPAANEAALAKVRADKAREAKAGHDGTWVAHPGLIAIAREAFDAVMPGKNQLDKLREDVSVSEQDLVRVPTGDRTMAGLRHNVRVGIQYLESWLAGNGCVPLYNLMEDAATAEISRSQVWQWLHHHATIDGEVLTEATVRRVVDEEMRIVQGEIGAARFDAGRFSEAKTMFLELATAPALADFLTLRAYEALA